MQFNNSFPSGFGIFHEFHNWHWLKIRTKGIFLLFWRFPNINIRKLKYICVWSVRRIKICFSCTESRWTYVFCKSSSRQIQSSIVMGLFAERKIDFYFSFHIKKGMSIFETWKFSISCQSSICLRLEKKNDELREPTNCRRINCRVETTKKKKCIMCRVSRDTLGMTKKLNYTVYRENVGVAKSTIVW